MNPTARELILLIEPSLTPNVRSVASNAQDSANRANVCRTLSPPPSCDAVLPPARRIRETKISILSGEATVPPKRFAAIGVITAASGAPQTRIHLKGRTNAASAQLARMTRVRVT
ncbi:hypothetical protein GCM10009650_06790 [Nesterenkonia jeotgali]